MRNLVAMLWSEWKDLALQIVEMNDEVKRIASSDAVCIRLRQMPEIGPLVATAIVASIGNGAAFQKGREFAACMGLVPRRQSTGGKAKLYLPASAGPSMILSFRSRGQTGCQRPSPIWISGSFQMLGTLLTGEDPDRAAEEITSFFRRIGWS